MKKTIYLLVMFFCIFPLTIVSTLGILFYSYRIECMVKEHLAAYTTVYTQGIEEYFQQRAAVMNMLVSAPELRESLHQANETGEGFKPEESVVYTKYLNNLMNTTSGVIKMELLDAKGIVLSGTAPQHIGKTSVVASFATELEGSGTRFTQIIFPGQGASDSKTIFAVCPIVVAGKIEGYFTEELNLSFFQAYISSVEFLEGGVLYLTDGTGTMVAAGSSEVTETDYLNSKESSLIGKSQDVDFRKNPEGLIQFIVNRSHYATYYMTVEGTEYRLFATINMGKVVSRENGFHVILLVEVFLVIVLLLILHRVTKRKLTDPIERVVATIKKIKNTKDFSMKIQEVPSGELGEVVSTINMLLDQIDRSNGELKESQEKYRIVMNQTEQIFCEWDYMHNKMVLSERFQSTFHYEIKEKTLRDGIKKLEECVHPEDRENYNKWAKQTYGAEAGTNVEVRLKTAEGRYIWCLLHFIPMFDAQYTLSCSIGIIRNIDREKKRTMLLRNRSMTDPMTGLLNKAAIEQQISDEIRKAEDKKSRFAVLFIDVDNFKNFNTQYGHSGGDEVLCHIAAQIKKHVTGYVGRNGGDEFLCCITEPVCVEQVESSVEEILEELRKGLVLNATGDSIVITCSIGIAYYPDTAQTLEELMKKADIAMYQAKEKGKDGYTII